MNQYIIPLPHNDPRLFSHVSHAFSLVDLGKRLLDAAKNGDVDEVTNLMGNGAPFTTDWLGISPLHFAAMNGHLSSCEALLQAGISRDARTKVDRTPLHLAAQEGHADIVELLLRNGADLDAKDMLRMTALHWAAERGHAPVVQMLMRFGANAHLQNKFEMTPLDIAESKGHTDARDAMLVCQDMAGCNGDLVHTNAYILTDEETLVPAAPPADEVTVTATTVEEEEEASKRKHLDVSKKEPQQTDRELLACKDSNPDSCHVATGSIFINQELSRTDGIGKVDGSRSTANDDINQDDGQDVMLVETPDGEKLFVRQQYGHTGPESLAIFTNTGEKVDDPSLLNQVIEAMCTLPRRSDLDEAEMDGVTMDIGCYASPDNPVENAPAPSQNPSRFRELDSLKVDESGDITPKTTARSLNTEHMIDIKPFSVSDDLCTTDDPNPMAKQPAVVHSVDSSDDIAEDDCTNSLVHQLAAVINDPTQRDRSICVEGVGLHASSESLYLWCLYNKLYIQNSTDDNHFVVKFEQNETMYTMSASYDPNTGIVVFDTCVE